MSFGGERGFTLLETLIALSIVSLLSVALLSVFSFGETVLRRSMVERAAGQHLLLAQETLSNALGELPVLPAQMISGSIDQLAFLGYPPRTTGISAPVRTSVRFDRPSERLIAVWEAGGTRPIQHDLFAASAVRFSFLSAKSGWSNMWQSPEPPALIRIALLRGSEGWRELTFAPRSVNEPGCRRQGSCKRF